MEDERDTTQVETIYGRFFAWKNDLITKQLEKFSAHTRNELAMLRSLILEGDNIIDIGAHIGTFSMPFASFIKRKGKIYAFEANPANYKLLVRNIACNGLEHVIHPENAAVSEHRDLQYSAMLPEGGNTGMYYFEVSSNSSDATVASVNIDDWHEQLDHRAPIDLIKIDVEGAEPLALQSCQKILAKFRPILFIEINADALVRFEKTTKDIEDLLSPFGYQYFRNIGPRNSKHDGFRIASLRNIESGGSFFDLLAVHPSDVRFPKNALNLQDLFGKT